MTYEALPFTLRPERAPIFSHIVRSIAQYESLFTDYERACPRECYRERNIPDMCPDCQRRIAHVMALLASPHARVWEVWAQDANLPVGILYLTNVIPGGDAEAHYVFFDGDLRSKTPLVERMIEWVFADHADEGWKALRRLTVEVPDFAFALARHAHKALGFSGDYVYKRHVGGRTITLPVEGVRKHALVWHGKPSDMLILGRVA